LSANPHKQEYPPLLPRGFHPVTVKALRELCVSGFPDSKSREEIMAGFEAIHERAVTVGVEGEAWVDGSFLTKKTEPQDIDFVILADARFRESGTPQQQEFIEWLISNEDDPKKSFRCHTDVVLLYPPDSPWYQLTLDTKRHWEEKVYGFSVSTREPKGIAVVKIGLLPAIAGVLL
jgi:hypothetical protein